MKYALYTIFFKMYSRIFILVIFAYATSAFGEDDLVLKERSFFKGLGECMLLDYDESKCKYDELKVSYNLFTSGNSAYRQLDARDLSQCPDPNKPVKMIIHGWHSSPSNQWVKDMNYAYFWKGNYNVIAIDWSKPAASLSYFSSAANTQCIGNMVGEFILNYLGPCGIPPENIHIIGHSLGAHVAGFAGKFVAKYTKSRKIYRISGLDMAGPCFEERKPRNRIYRGDADIVDLYHTDSMVGCTDSVGDFDFFINNGLKGQPGCDDNLNTFDDYIQGVFHCSHGRVTEYFTESINSDKFVASKCEKLLLGFKITGPDAIMGEDLTMNSPHGIYCIRTNSKPPYAKG